MAFCRECGALLTDGALFCTQCGTPVQPMPEMEVPAAPEVRLAEEPAAEPVQVDIPEPAGESGWYASAPEEAAPAPQPAPAWEQPEQQMPPVFYDAPRQTPPPQQPMYSMPEKPVSPWMYVLLMLVFSIPVVGLIVTIVMVCGAASNKNIRNFAWAYIITWLIGIVLAIILLAVAVPVLAEVFNELEYIFEDAYYYGYTAAPGIKTILQSLI